MSNAHSTSSSAGDHQGGGHHGPHVASMNSLIGVFVALLVLTAATVGITYVDLGPFNLTVALLIAAVKASLVALFFMHMVHDTGFNRLVILSSLIFFALFLGLVMVDVNEYLPTIDWIETVNK